MPFNLYKKIFKAAVNTCACAMCLLPISAKQLAASDIIITSNIENILVAKISSIPNNPNPEVLEYAEGDQCEFLDIEPELKSAKLISNKGWAITSQVVYGPYELVSFAGQFERIHTWCFADQTNIAIFHKDTLLGLIYTTEEASMALGGIELLKTSQIAIIPTWVFSKSQSAVLTFRKNQISIDEPYYSMACKLDGIIPDIQGLEIAEARNILFDYGWKPRNGKELDDMGDMRLWYSEMQDLTPELRTCGGAGFLRCWYNYESKDSYLEVLAVGEPEPSVSGAVGSCKF
mgnify:CR=1 FL=1